MIITCNYAHEHKQQQKTQLKPNTERLKTLKKQ